MVLLKSDYPVYRTPGQIPEMGQIPVFSQILSARILGYIAEIAYSRALRYVKN